MGIFERIKDRSFQSMIIWIITILTVIIVVSITRAPGALLACIILCIYNQKNYFKVYSNICI